MQSIVLRYVGLFLVLATLSCPEAAPSADKLSAVEPSKVEQLVRVYPINEEQYEKLLKLTNGKNVISEARLTSAGFTSVRNSLDSGWNSLLRIMGLTTTSRSELAKIDIDGQPLCVMKRSLDETEPRGVETKAASDEESVINCIVVLKKESVVEPQTAVDTSNPSFAPYWYHESNAPVAPPQQQLPLEPQASAAMAEQPAASAEENEQRQVVTTTAAPKVNKIKSKPKSKSKSKTRSRKQTKKPVTNAAASRQYGSPYGVPPSPYGGSYAGSYPYGGYSQNPFNPYGQQPGFGQFPSFGQQPGFGQYPSFGQQPYYPPSPFPGSPSPYNPYPYYEQPESDFEEEDEDEDDEGYEGYEVDASYENEYYE